MKKYLVVVVLAMLTVTGCGVDTAAASTSPTATPNRANAYVANIRPDLAVLQKDLAATQTDCGASNSDGCYSDMQTLSDDVHRAQDAMKAVPVPACLTSVDANLRTALQLLDKSAQTTMQGISQNDTYLLDSAGSYMTQAGRYIGDVNTGLETATC